MEYRLKVNDKEVNARLERKDDLFFITIDDREYCVSKRAGDGQGLNLAVDGKHVRAYTSGSDGDMQVMLSGCLHSVRDLDLLEQEGGRKGSALSGPDTVTPPMPAVVIAVSVSVGDSVKEKDPVAVISAMKMETTLYSPFDGVVTAVNTAEGDKVMPGDILVDIEKEE